MVHEDELKTGSPVHMLQNARDAKDSFTVPVHERSRLERLH